MISLEYPAYDYKIKGERGREIIFDELRKAWVRLTPEEWVRQNFLQYLVKVKLYPAALIAVEKEIWLGEMKKRFDILVYDTAHRPWMMVECKSVDVPLGEPVLHQLLHYNLTVPVSYLIITNGSYVMGFQRTGNGLLPLEELPAVTEMKAAGETNG